MGSMTDSVNLVASGTIAPYRLVYISAARACAQVDTTARRIVGVTDPSTRRFDSANHAELLDPVSLQNGNIVYVEAGNTISAGDLLQADSSGRVITAVTTATGAGVLNQQSLIALDAAAAAGEKIPCVWAKNMNAYN